jgi:hypothetical protein
VQQPEGIRTDHHVAHEIVAHIRRDLSPARIGGVEHHVGDHREEAARLPLHDDIAAHGGFFGAGVPIEFDFQPFAERSADDHAQQFVGGRLVG